MRTIIVGVGNPILGDDGVGIHIIRRLMETADLPDTDIEEVYTGGMNLLDLLIGYDRAIIVDAVTIPGSNVGDVRRLDLDDLPSRHTLNPHDTGLKEAIDLSKKAGQEAIPEEIIIIGVGIDPVDTFGEELSPEVEGSIGKALEMINEEIDRS